MAKGTFIEAKCHWDGTLLGSLLNHRSRRREEGGAHHDFRPKEKVDRYKGMLSPRFG